LFLMSEVPLQRHREAKTGPAVQEFKDDGTLKDMKVPIPPTAESTAASC